MLIQDGPMRRYWLAKLAIWPIEYDAERMSITILTEVQVRIRTRALTAEEHASTLHISRPDGIDGPFGEYRAWVKQTVLNPEAAERFYPRPVVDEEDSGHDEGTEGARRAPAGNLVSQWPSRDDRDVTMVIITNDRDESGNWLGSGPSDRMSDRFRAYKEILDSYGITTEIRTVSEIVAEYGSTVSTIPAAIHAFINSAVTDWGTTWVLLGGDDAVVPTARLHGPGGFYSPWERHDPPSDYWYTRVGQTLESWNSDLDAWLAESESDMAVHGYSSVVVSRLPARNSAEAGDMIDKIIRYQGWWNDPSDRPPASFWSTAVLAAGALHSGMAGPNNGIYDTETHIVTTLDNSPDAWSIHRLYPDYNSIVAPVGCPEQGGSNLCYYELRNYVEDHISPTDGYWLGDALRESIDDGTHLVYHVEHSFRDRIGRPTFGRAPTGVCTGWTQGIRDTCASLAEYTFKYQVDYLDPNQALALQNGVSQAEFSIVFSQGCETAKWDMDAVGEAFLRAPNGGAVAYVGQQQSGVSRWDLHRNALEGAFGASRVPGTFCEQWNWALEQTWSADWFHAMVEASSVVLLTSPALTAHTAAVGDMTIAVSPPTISSLGSQNVTVTVRRAGSLTGVPNALVCIRQGDFTYARANAGENGVAAFRGLAVQDLDSVYVSAVHPDYYPSVSRVPVQAATSFLAYQNHRIDDAVSGGDSDGVTEAGENVTIHTTVRNTGNSPSLAGTAILRGTAPFTVEIKINGSYRPADILIGAKAAHPSADADTFRVPITRDGIATEGPPSPIGIIRESFRLWRDDLTGVYTIGGYSVSASADSVFTGVIRDVAEVTDVTLVGEGNDQFVLQGDSLWFQFHGDATEDRISFRSEAPNWLAITTSSRVLPSLQPGDSATVTFNASLLPAVPDRQNLIFRLTACEGLLPNRYCQTSFVEPVAAPRVVPLFVEQSFDSCGCQDVSWKWTPVLHNTGSGQADSVRVILRKTAGLMTVTDSVVVVPAIASDSLVSVCDFCLCGTSLADTGDRRQSERRRYLHDRGDGELLKPMLRGRSRLPN